MKLEKAIEHGERKIEQKVFQVDPEAFVALMLLIQAGKEVVRARGGNPALDGELLPGETEEGD